MFCKQALSRKNTAKAAQVPTAESQRAPIALGLPPACGVCRPHPCGFVPAKQGCALPGTESALYPAFWRGLNRFMIRLKDSARETGFSTMRVARVLNSVRGAAPQKNSPAYTRDGRAAGLCAECTGMGACLPIVPPHCGGALSADENSFKEVCKSNFSVPLSERPKTAALI